MQIIDNIPIWGDPDPATVLQMIEAMKYEAAYGALMADHHLGYSVPVGGVIAYEGRICVNGVGYDIACGNKAVRLDVDVQEVKKNIYRTMNEIQSKISFGIGRENNEKVEHALFDDPIWNEIELLKGLKDKAQSQLGTIGSGNHYVDVFVDELGRVWVGVHFGSRGLGHSIATHFVNVGGGKDGIHAKPVLFNEQSEAGMAYLRCMELAGRYAYAGRDWVCQRVAQILRGNIVEEIHNHHNFAWRENHFGRDLWVVRKGATPCFPGQKGFVGGSMGDISVILEGVEGKTSNQSLYSTIHGAGRILGRTQAKGKRDKRGNIVKPGCVSKENMHDWIKTRDIELRGADVDEAPQCYKRIEKVLEAHMDTIRIIHTLKPIGVCMAGGNIFDLYKD